MNCNRSLKLKSKIFLLFIYRSDSRNLTREVVEGNRLNITCRLILEGNPLVVWTKNNIPLKASWSKYLVIERVKRNDSGDYACVSVAKSANQTSAITTVDVLCEYRHPNMYPGLGGGLQDNKNRKQNKLFIIHVIVFTVFLFCYYSTFLSLVEFRECG